VSTPVGILDAILDIWICIRDSTRSTDEVQAELLRNLPRMVLLAAVQEHRVDDALAALRPQSLILRMGQKEFVVPLHPQDG